jgi:hypothetical protein
MTRYLVLGGQQRTIRDYDQYKEWLGYSKAIALEFDSRTGSLTPAFEYQTPPHNTHDLPNASVLFKAGTISGNQLLTCTQTEVLIYSLPDYQLQQVISLPCFNDLHHVTPSPDGNLLVVSTGLDTVFEVSLDGEVLRHWEVSDFSLWDRFDRNTDYRKVPTTKPHTNHPNYCFEFAGDLWATRFHDKDAINLQTRQTMSVEVGHPHDGIVHGDTVTFTTVNGCVVQVRPHDDSRTVFSLEQIIDSRKQIGWCRGLCRISDLHYLVGFSRMRTTKFSDYVLWLKRKIKPEGFQGTLPTRLVEYNLRESQQIREINLEPCNMHAVFSILPLP